MSRNPQDLERERRKWRSFPRRRPDRIETPGPGQESVWDYPRPPRVEQTSRPVRVEFGGIVLAKSERALRVLETSSPPVYYIPQADVRMEFLVPDAGTTFCEWKGLALYWSVRVGERLAERAAWSYPTPDPGYACIRDCVAFYPGMMDACYLGNERVQAQPGQYYVGGLPQR